ncbi:RES family NAD+ phosphorylase [Devosia beringensis]|uniref:RES family NAD+ phosphorylase n=1 Tax=Devosia beringensis TaxID=2657486 RepID=UPI00186B7407|nr:RES family NAD+ phosphorylase [Devosia beringensis]
MSIAHAAAPRPAHRLIPSQFPPIGLFDTVTRAADLEAVMELAGWTNDRLVAERLGRLPASDWVFGRPNASVVMAAFLHAPVSGARFSCPDLGAWYAAASIDTAIAEVAHHLRREAFARRLPTASRRYRAYGCQLLGRYRDIRGLDDGALYSRTSYAASQAFGEGLRAAGEDGVIYDSLRHQGGVAICAYRPGKIVEVVQADHVDIAVTVASPTITVTRLAG